MSTARDSLAPSIVRNEPGMGTVEVFALPVDEASLLAVLRDVFENHWSEIRFGVLVLLVIYPRLAMYFA